MMQPLYGAAFSLWGDQYELTQTSENSAITSGRKTFADTAEDTLHIIYLS